MAVTKTFVPYAVQAGASLIDQVQNQVVSAGLDLVLLGGDGSVFNKYAGVATKRQGMTFDTTKIATALGISALSGLKITAGTVFTAFFQKTAEGSTRAGAASHVKLIQNEGILIPTGITVANDQPAVISYAAMATYDGTNEPFAVTINQSLSGTPDVDEAFTIGPMSLNGTAITEIQSYEIDFGIDAQVIGGDGEGQVTYVYIRKTQPSITAITLDVETVLNAFGLGGTAQTATDSIVYLRKILEGSSRVANNVAEHISFSMDEGIMHTSEASATEGSEATASIILTPTFDNTNDPFVLDLATTIV